MTSILIDIGNTKTAFVQWDSHRIHGEISHVATDQLIPFLESSNASFLAKASSLAIVSVVPQKEELFIQRYPQAISLYRNTNWNTFPIRIPTEIQGKLGADRIANLLAAWKLFSPPAVIIDAGTATTIEILTSDCSFGGGIILPGRQLMLSSLHTGTAQLPFLSPSHDLLPPWQLTTSNAIHSGINHLYLGGLFHILQLIHNQYDSRGQQCTYLLTGGDADFFFTHLSHVANSIPIQRAPLGFTLHGIGVWFDYIQATHQS